ncbi:MAG: M48 family metalloprotease [Betaproteobacteria bacterium]
MNKRLSVAVALVFVLVAGCGVSRGPSSEQMRAQQEMMQQQMQMRTDELETQMREMQEKMETANQPRERATTAENEASANPDLARQRREQMQEAKRQREESLREMRSDPDTMQALEEHKKMMRANPSGVQSEFNLGDREEAALGLEMAASLLGDQKLVEDPALAQYVNRVGMWVAQQSERPGLPWQFGVIDSDSVNAFAVPGGYVFVTRGMLGLLESESELAGVLGHEISHVVRKHHLRWIYMNRDMQASSSRAKASIRKFNPKMLGEFDRMDRLMAQQAAFMNSGPMRANLTRSEEMQADNDGAVLAWRAGYECWGLVSALQRFEAWQRPRRDATPAKVADHPEPIQRLKMLDATLRSRPEKETLGEVGDERYLGATRVIKSAAN